MTRSGATDAPPVGFPLPAGVCRRERGGVAARIGVPLRGGLATAVLLS